MYQNPGKLRFLVNDGTRLFYQNIEKSNIAHLTVLLNKVVNSNLWIFPKKAARDKAFLLVPYHLKRKKISVSISIYEPDIINAVVCGWEKFVKDVWYSFLRYHDCSGSSIGRVSEW